MMIGVLDMFTVGIGPSSSHTVGPMRAARCFIESLARAQVIERLERINSTLYGSLALTGAGHGTDKAVLLGLEGHSPEEVPVDEIPSILDRIRSTKRLVVPPGRTISFDEGRDLHFNRTETLAKHSNGMRFEAFDLAGQCLLAKVYFSVGGGFIVDDGPENQSGRSGEETRPYPFRCGDEMMALGRASRLSVSQMTLENENRLRPERETRAALLRVWQVMQECVQRGCHDRANLPGGLSLRRRASRLYQDLTVRPEAGLHDPLTVMDWVSLWAMAVNEENAAGHRVVTAPTNGAAGVIPAVLHYYVFNTRKQPRGAWPSASRFANYDL